MWVTALIMLMVRIGDSDSGTDSDSKNHEWVLGTFSVFTLGQFSSGNGAFWQFRRQTADPLVRRTRVHAAEIVVFVELAQESLVSESRTAQFPSEFPDGNRLDALLHLQRDILDSWRTLGTFQRPTRRPR